MAPYTPWRTSVGRCRGRTSLGRCRGQVLQLQLQLQSHLLGARPVKLTSNLLQLPSYLLDL